MRLFCKKNITAVKVHVTLAAVWSLMAIPTVLYWSKSVLWVGVMSCYALFIGHIASYQAASGAGVDQATHEKLNAIADALADFLAEAGHAEHARELRRTVGLELEEET